MVAVAEYVSGNFVLQQFRNVSISTRRHPFSACPRREGRESRLCPYVERIRTCRRPNSGGAARAVSTTRRICPAPRSPEAVHGRAGKNYRALEAAFSLIVNLHHTFVPVPYFSFANPRNIPNPGNRNYGSNTEAGWPYGLPGVKSLLSICSPHRPLPNSRKPFM